MRAEVHLDLQFDVPEDTHAQFLPGHSSPQIAHVVHLLIAENLCHNISRRNSLGAFSSLELAQSLAEGVGVVNACSFVGDVVVADEVDPLFVEEILSDDPGSVGQHFIDVFVLRNHLDAFLLGGNGGA